MQTPKKGSPRIRQMTSVSELSRQFLEKLAQRVGCPEQVRLVELWQNWDVVMGEDIAGLGLPLGHRAQCLEVGVEDSMAMQELLYFRGEIVARANSFMESNFFSDVKFSLVLDKKCLSKSDPVEKIENRKSQEVPLAATGKWLSEMDPDSAIARCYRAYSRMNDK